jgi:hypothetical protein
MAGEFQMKALKFALFALLLVSFAESSLATTALFSHSYIDGTTKVCIYKSYYGSHAITIKAHQICPGSIEVD